MEEGGVHINCNSRPFTTSLFFFFFLSPFPQQKALNPNTLSPLHTHTHTHTHAHTQVCTHSKSQGWERDNRETTAVSYRKCITAWSGQRSGGEEVVGLRRAWTSGARARLLPLSVVNCSDLQGLQGYGRPILIIIRPRMAVVSRA